MNFTNMLNGRLVSAEAFCLPIDDLSVLRGSAVFELLVTYNQKPFMLREHLDRLANSAQLFGIPMLRSIEQLQSDIYAVLAANVGIPGERVIRILLTPGKLAGSIGFVSGSGIVAIMLHERISYSSELKNRGISVVTEEYQRPMPQAKTTNYVEAFLRFNNPANAKLGEVIYTKNNLVLEGATSNVFAFIAGKLYAPIENALCGITRDVVLTKLGLNLPFVKESLTVKQLEGADEVFITSSIREIFPVTNLNGQDISQGSAGALTREIMTTFKRFAEQL